ncbi:MAG: signal recognition particle receptor subunit alpha, partial [Burkholderiaceae bacterium]
MIGFLNIPGLSRLKSGLTKTRDQLSRLMGRPVVDEDWFEEVESALIMADAGAQTSAQIVAELRASLKQRPVDQQGDPNGLRERLASLLAERLERIAPKVTAGEDPAKPRVIMVVGVNGAGKTTSIGKLAHQFKSQGQRVVLAAGDTFRAAAREQLMTWGERNGVDVVAQTEGDPAAVAFDAVKAGQARG